MKNDNSYVRVEKKLEKLVAHDSYDVIALTGAWGVGKTYLWNKLKNSSSKEKVKSSICVSLFGAKSIDEIKLRILRNAYLSNAKETRKLINAGIDIADGLAKKLFGYSVNEGSLVWLPNLLKEKLVILDDIERRVEGLEIQEIMGFLNEYSEGYKVSFLILLNQEKLGDKQKKDWEILHEKVIDIEVVLNPSPAEALEVAMGDDIYKYRDQIERAISILKVTNIRVLKKILVNVKFIEEKFNKAKLDLTYGVPSIVLLTTIHFRAMENPPTIDYIESFNSYLSQKNINPDSSENYWNSILKQLDISHTDEFEKLFNNYLCSGELDEGAFDDLIESYKESLNSREVEQKRINLFKRYYWDKEKTNSDLLEMGHEFIDLAKLMPPSSITDVVEFIENLGDKKMADDILTAWEDSLANRPAFQRLEERMFDPQLRKLHPRVTKKIEELLGVQYPPLTIYEVVRNIIKNSGWGDRERNALSSSTKEQYLDTIKSLEFSELESFFLLHLEWLTRGVPDPMLERGLENFIDVCKDIVGGSEGRLKDIVYMAFKNRNLLEKLSADALKSE